MINEMRYLGLARAWPALAALLLGACSESSRRSDVLDGGMGVEVPVIESGSSSWRADGGWQISELPSLSIGQVEGDLRYVFDGVRGVRRLGDGSIVAADAGTSEVRFFDQNGSYVRSVGRPGDGPGEFHFISSFWTHGADSLVVTDQNGVTFMDSSGAFLRRVRLAMAEGSHLPNAVGQDATGTFLVVTGSGGFGFHDVGRVLQDTLRFYWYRPEGTEGGAIGALPSAARWGLRAGGVTTFPYLPFASEPIWAVAKDRFYIGTGQAPEVLVWSPRGSLDHVVRWPTTPRAVTEDLRSRFRVEYRQSARDGNDRRRAEQFLAEAPMVETLPSYEGMLVDAGGNLWLERYHPWWEREETWDVVTSAGEWLGGVRLPVGFHPHQIGVDFVLGVSVDDLGVERIESYALAKGEE